MTFKVTEDEDRYIRSRAIQENLTLSDYLRRHAKGTVIETSTPFLVRCEHTGAMIFAPVSGEPPLTTESVREMLADFP